VVATVSRVRSARDSLAPPSDLQQRLTALGAPVALVEWARPCADVESCWRTCASPEWLLWLAARLAATSEERHAVVSCLAELTRRAEHAGRDADAAVGQALDAAVAWSHTAARLDDLLSTELAALGAAERARAAATEESSRARTLFSTAPRLRPASFGTSRAMAAWIEWRKADYGARLALAAAGTARAAAEAAWIDTIQAGGAAQHPDGFAPGRQAAAAGRWVTSTAAAAGHAVSALALAQGERSDERAARKSARLIRQRLACPRLGWRSGY
jgi:hypothetical protein